MERLSALDTSFLYLERPHTPMHISSLAVYEGPPPADKELADMLERRLPLVPRFRQRLASVPFGAHRPMWVDDDRFDINEHLQHVVIGEPTEEALMDICGYILSPMLSRVRPLWEMWLITGLDRDRFAILSKTHHCLWDGITGVDLHSVLLDDSPTPRIDLPIHVEREPNPSGFGMLTRALRDRVIDTIDATRTIAGAMRDPISTVKQTQRFVRDATSFAGSLLTPAPRSGLNVRTGMGRRFAVARGSLREAKDLRHTMGVSVNDVILAAVAGGIREWQIRRDVEPHDVRVMVPVSTRSDDPNDQTTFGNKVAMVVVTLPCADRTSVMRLDRVHRAMEKAKTSGHVSASQAITGMSGSMPTAGIAALSRMQAVARPFNLLVTNVPGPQMPLYLLGRKLVELYGQAPLASRQGLSIAALSYDGKIGFGFLGDRERMGDLDVLARSVESSMDDLMFHGALDVAVPAGPSVQSLMGAAPVAADR